MISLLAGLLTGLSVRPFLDQVSDYSTPRLGLLTQPISLANKAPNCHHSLSAPVHRLLRARVPAVPTRFRLAEPHRPDESYGRPTGRNSCRTTTPPHLNPRNMQSRLYQTLAQNPSHWSPQNSHDQPSAEDGTP